MKFTLSLLLTFLLMGSVAMAQSYSPDAYKYRETTNAAKIYYEIDADLENHSTVDEIYFYTAGIKPGETLSSKIDNGIRSGDFLTYKMNTLSFAKADPNNKYYIALYLVAQRTVKLGEWDGFWADNSVKLGQSVSITLNTNLEVETKNLSVTFRGYEYYRAVNNMYVNINRGDSVKYEVRVVQDVKWWKDTTLPQKDVTFKGNLLTTKAGTVPRQGTVALWIALQRQAEQTQKSIDFLNAENAKRFLGLESTIEQLSMTTTNLFNDARQGIKQNAQSIAALQVQAAGLSNSIVANSNSLQRQINTVSNEVVNVTGRTDSVESKFSGISKEQLTLISKLQQDAQNIRQDISNITSHQTITTAQIENTKTSLQRLKDQLNTLEQSAVTQPGLQKIIRELKQYIAQAEMDAGRLDEEQQQQRQNSLGGQNKIPLKK
ncbi:MAG: hypothetical protein WCG27_11740 [Pseudomonadota bacterium]